MQIWEIFLFTAVDVLRVMVVEDKLQINNDFYEFIAFLFCSPFYKGEYHN